MGSNVIRGMTVEIGGDTTKLGKALEDVNKKSRSLSSELGQINRLLKLDPGNADLLAQKQEVLADAIANTSSKLETLREAEQQVQSQFDKGEASEEQVRALRREIIQTENALGRYEAAARETDEALEQVANGSADAGKKTDDYADAADKAEKSSDKLGGTLSKDVLPKLINALKWCTNHFTEIKSVAVGFLAALAVSKIASFATSLGTTLVGAFAKLTGALGTATTAQYGMNAAAAVNPYVLLAEVVIALAAALGTYLNGKLEESKQRGMDAAEAMYGLTDAEKAAADSANAAADAFRAQRDAMDESITSLSSQFSYVSSLKDELLNLADANGQVADKDRNRAEFILGELNTALGTEYTMTQNQITNYQTLAAEIDTVIQKKKAEMLMEASADAYIAAIKGKQQAEDDYYTNLKANMEAETAWKQAAMEMDQLQKDFKGAIFTWEQWQVANKIKEKEGELTALKGILDETSTAYEGNKEALAGYYNDIGQYETAQMLLLQGDTEEASRLLSDREYYQKKYADAVGFASEEVRNTWEQEAIDAGVKAKLIRENWEKGVEGYTEEMVKEAEENYQAALEAMGTAYDDAAAVGSDVTNGLADGMESGRFGLLEKAKSLVNGIMSAFRQAADSHSPSRKAKKIFEDIGAGAEIGLDNKTKPLVHIAKDQVNQLMGTYCDMARDSQLALQRAEASRTTTPEPAGPNVFDVLGGKLDALLAAVERGQVLVIDGDQLVGATADKYDTTLGRRRALAARGAV